MTLLIVLITTFAVCVAGVIIPIINPEIYLLSAAALSPPSYVAPLVVAATLGQMTGKVAMFYGGRGVLHIRHDRVRHGVARLRATAGRLIHFAVVALVPQFVRGVAG